MINWGSWLLWGLMSTIVLTSILAGSQGLGVTRMNLPYLLGTMFTPDRGRAKLIGIFIHFLNGWVFSFVYVVAFELLGRSTWWLGAVFGLAHAIFLLAVVLPVMPSLHPRVANEQWGPTVERQLEPPGFFGLHYGIQTPVSVFVAHVTFGALLGALYTLR